MTTATPIQNSYNPQYVVGYDIFADLAAAKTLAQDIGRKFEPVDIDASLYRAATAYILEYQNAVGNGTRARFDFMESMMISFDSYRGSLTVGQIKGILNVMRADLIRTEAKAEEPKQVEMAQDGKHLVRNGTYTIILNGDDDYVTLKIKAAKFAKDMPEGTQMACYLSGADNESDFTGFAFVQGRTAKVWSRFRNNSRIGDALRILLNGGDDDAGERYAMASGNCYCCNRKLTVPASLHRGLGPVCAAKGG